MWEFWSKRKETFKAKMRGFIKAGLDLLGFTVIEDKDKGVGVKTKDGIICLIQRKIFMRSHQMR